MTQETAGPSRAHIRAAARRGRVPAYAVEAQVLRLLGRGLTLEQVIAGLRRRRACTRRAARQVADRAEEVARSVIAQWRRGEARRAARRRQPAPSVGERIAHQVRRWAGGALPGGEYSRAETRWVVAAGSPAAWTETEEGWVEYGGRYRRGVVAATHHVRCRLSGLARCRRAGLPAVVDEHVLVDCAPGGAPGVWRVTCLRTVRGRRADGPVSLWLARQPGGMWHLARTRRAALDAQLAAEAAARRARARASGYAADLAPGGRVDAATLRAWGWCDGGVRLFARRHRACRAMGQRLRRGVRVEALERLILAHGGARDAYERRLLACAEAYRAASAN